MESFCDLVNSQKAGSHAANYPSPLPPLCVCVCVNDSFSSKVLGMEPTEFRTNALPLSYTLSLQTLSSLACVNQDTHRCSLSGHAPLPSPIAIIAQSLSWLPSSYCVTSCVSFYPWSFPTPSFQRFSNFLNLNSYTSQASEEHFLCLRHCTEGFISIDMVKMSHHLWDISIFSVYR